MKQQVCWEEKDERSATRLVEVEFCGKYFSYLCDFDEVAVGDLVTVTGVYENCIGTVKRVLKYFKIPKFSMKWVTAVLDRDISGEYEHFGKYILSYTSVLTAEKFFTLSLERKYRANAAIGEGGAEVCLSDFDEDDAFEGEVVLYKGEGLYRANAVRFLTFDGKKGCAIVRGSSDWYELEFELSGEEVTVPACDCPCFGACKHAAAVLYALREIKRSLFHGEDFKPFTLCNHSDFANLLANGKGKVVLEY